MTTLEKCPLCEKNAQISGATNIMVNCSNCGSYTISRKLLINMKNDQDLQNKKHLIVGYIREKTNGEISISTEKLVQLSTENINDILNSPLICRTPAEKANKLLSYLYRQNKPFGYIFDRRNFSIAICYAYNISEFVEIIYDLIKRDLLEGEVFNHDNLFETSNRFKLTSKGYQYCEDLLKNTPVKTNQAFVAMWFGDSSISDTENIESQEGMKKVFEEAIKPAAKDAGGFKAIRIDNKEHNNDITDEIIAGIKESRFVIADMTGYRGGVYYEAGYAKGLGKEVIFTCHENWFKSDEPLHNVHFDIDHINMIVWKDIEDLKTRLTNRIKATIL